MTQIRKCILPSTIVLAFLGNAVMPAAALDASQVAAAKKTKLGLYLSAKEAYDYVQKNKGTTLFVDVRTPSELLYLGTSTMTNAHVPYELLDTTKWDDKKSEYRQYISKSFVADIAARLKQQNLGKEDTIILMCRSGNRSAGGVNLLAAAGYTKVYNQVEGYEGDKAKSGANQGRRTVNGWKNAGLPWTYELKKDVMYLTK